MTPYDLIGRPYRLGADFAIHGSGDCLSLARTVLKHCGIDTPQPQRDWYRRIRRGDTQIFYEQLESWGQLIDEPRLGSVALCQADNGYGLAVWWDGGFLHYRGMEVVWSPVNALDVSGLYAQNLQRLLCKP